MEIWDIYDCNREKTGRTHERGKPMLAGDYHIVVFIWIQNSKGEFLVTKRTPNKEYPNLWECTGGSAVAGDTSLEAALREVKEETGLTLDPLKGQVLLSYRRDKLRMPDICDVWLFKQDFDISEVVLQQGETCAAKWVTEQEIRNLIDTGKFVPVLEHIEKVFDNNKKSMISQSVAYCGLICHLCHLADKCDGCRTETNCCGCRKIPEGCYQYNCCTAKDISGCWECDIAPCDKGMFSSNHDLRLRAFIRFINENSKEKLAECIHNNMQKGIFYGHGKDYDNLRSEDEVIKKLEL